MELIDFQGLNCYYNCIVTVAEELGADWSASFASLWSETDFKFDPFRKVYLSKRMLGDLARLGAELKMLPCELPEEAAASLDLFDPGELFLVGMDAFYLPWVPLFGALHGPHYFIVRNTEAEELPCFDPTYGDRDVPLARSEILAHAFDLSSIRPTERSSERPPAARLIRMEAETIIQTHPALLEQLMSKTNDCLYEGRERASELAKYADALLGNRYLYRHYLKHGPERAGAPGLFSDKDFFSEWTAVKNGLYKAAVSPSNRLLLDEIRKIMRGLIELELTAAEEVLCSCGSLWQATARP